MRGIRKRNYNSMGARTRTRQIGYVVSDRRGGGGGGRPVEHQQLPLSVSHDAIRRMLHGEPMDEPFLVKLIEPRCIVPNNHECGDGKDEGEVTEQSFRARHSIAAAATATLCDDNHFQEVILLNNCERDLLDQGSCNFIVSINGYVTSSCNSSTTGYLAITDLHVVQKQPVPRHQREPSIGARSTPNLGLERSLQGGSFASFLTDRVPFFSNEDLTGRGQIFSGVLAESIRKISQCLAHHAAMMTLRSSSNVSASEAATSLTKTDCYHQALAEFSASQLDRQKASLTSNAGKEDVTRSQLVVEKYSEALKVAVSSVPGSFLTTAGLQQWHAIICGEGLHPNAGRFRTSNVRVGCTSFCPVERLSTDVEQLIQGLHSLQARLFLHNGTIPSGESDIHHLGWRAITLTAAVVFGILDIHPFSDGNGRLSRVAMNWALRYSGLPFVVNLFATPAQRSEYVTAILETRRNTTLITRGKVSQEAFHDAYCNAGLLFPLMEVIADRVARAAMEFQKLCQEKSKLASEAAEARAARVFRERAAQGCCLICLDEKPNIATLCCGKAVHLNCMAEWLSSQSSCPQCRAEMPALLPAVSRGGGAPPANEIDDTSTNTDDENIHVEGDTVDSANDETTIEEVNMNLNNNYQPDDDTTEETDEMADTTVETRNFSQPAPVYCGHFGCHNRAAVDCSVGYCGRCCVLYSFTSCERHNH